MSGRDTAELWQMVSTRHMPDDALSPQCLRPAPMHECREDCYDTGEHRYDTSIWLCMVNWSAANEQAPIPVRSGLKGQYHKLKIELQASATGSESRDRQVDPENLKSKNV